MMVPKALIQIILLVSTLAPLATTQITSQSAPGPSSLPLLTMTKLKTNATGSGPCLIDSFTPTGSPVKVSGTLFTRIRVILNLTLTASNQTYPISLSNFFLLVTQKNVVIANTTNVNQNQAPTNTIGSFLLFPNLPVILILSFVPVCVTASSIPELLYLDGTYSFIFNLP